MKHPMALRGATRYDGARFDASAGGTGSPTHVRALLRGRNSPRKGRSAALVKRLSTITPK